MVVPPHSARPISCVWVSTMKYSFVKRTEHQSQFALVEVLQAQSTSELRPRCIPKCWECAKTSQTHNFVESSVLACAFEFPDNRLRRKNHTCSCLFCANLEHNRFCWRALVSTGPHVNVTPLKTERSQIPFAKFGNKLVILQLREAQLPNIARFLSLRRIWI